MALEIVTLADGTKQVVHTSPLQGVVTSTLAPSLSEVKAALVKLKQVAIKHEATIQEAVNTLEAFIATR
jgi:hypothetical protein